MRNPLPALAAFTKDALAVSDPSGDVETSLGEWLVVTKAAERLSALQADDRESYMRSLPPRTLPPVGARPTLVHDGLPAPEDALGQLAERFRAEAERMERAGCLEMAFSTVSAVCRLAREADGVTKMLASAHLGRVARQLGDLRTANECYSDVVSEASRKRDGPMQALGLLGLGALARMRGNRPEERRLYGSALLKAQPGGITERSAHQGLMNAAISEERAVDALLHGWRAFDLAPEGDDSRAMILSNLALTALSTDFIDAAISGYLHVLSMTTVDRIRLLALGGIMRAFAIRGDRASVLQFEDEGIRATARANMAFEIATFFVYASEAWTTFPDVERATRLLDRADLSVQSTQFHELSIRADQLRSYLRASVTATRAPLRVSSWAAPTSSGWDSQVSVSIRRLSRL